MQNQETYRIKTFDIAKQADRWIMDIVPTTNAQLEITLFTDSVKYAKPFSYTEFESYSIANKEKHYIHYENPSKSHIRQYDALSDKRPYIITTANNQDVPTMIIKPFFETESDAKIALTELAEKIIIAQIISQGYSETDIINNLKQPVIVDNTRKLKEQYAVEKLNILNVGDKSNPLAKDLSNFTERHFIIDGVTCHSIEGFIQSLKFSDPEKQKEICKSVGPIAKSLGKQATKDWKLDNKLYWNGQTIDRRSDEYQEIITKLFDTVFDQDPTYREAIKQAQPFILIHSIGKLYFYQTTLTQKEFVNQLNRLKQRIGDD